MNAILALTAPLLLLAALLYFWLRLAVRASGWETLAHQYRWPAPFEGDTCPRQTIWFTFGLVIWRSLTVKANEDGLLLRPHFPYSLFALQLRIPWEDLHLEQQGVLHCNAVPEVRIRVSPDLQVHLERLRHDFEPPRAPESP